MSIWQRYIMEKVQKYEVLKMEISDIMFREVCREGSKLFEQKTYCN